MTDAMATRPDFQATLRETNAYACLDCGKCTSICPVALQGRRFSPRQLLTRTLRYADNGSFQKDDIWSCLTCKQCETTCPSNVHYSDIMPALRSSARTVGNSGRCTHAGGLHAVQRLMADEELQQDRLAWLTDDLQVTDQGDVLYFVGCTPYFEVFFSNLDIEPLEASRSAIRLLNNLGITPVVMADERCCGHDLLWSGDEDHFRALALHNVSAIEDTGAKTILFSCAECMSAFKELYPRYGLNLAMEMKHMSEFLNDSIEDGSLALSQPDISVTYQDPCRLGRHLGVYDAPRQVLAAGDGTHFHEMRQHGKGALCCGVSAWMNCDADSKAIQVERLRQANEAGAQVMAVACPKCQIHLACAMKDEGVRDRYGLEIKDIATLTLDRMVAS